MALEITHSHPSADREGIEEMGVRLSNVVSGRRVRDNKQKFNLL